MTARLEITSGPEKGKEVDLAEGRIHVFGRDASCDLQLTDLLSSRRHFQVGFEGGAWVLKDLGSSNGTLLNEARTSGERLKSGDVIRVGDTRIRFVSGSEKAQAAEPAAGDDLLAKRAKGDPLIGATFGGYRIEDFIGRGGMGTVYKATQISLNRKVALKILAPGMTSDKKFIDMFIKEARAAGALNHPNIVQVYDVAEENGTHFFSMELMTHGSVGDRLKQLGKLSAPKALEMIIHAAKGLEYAEKKSLVHCDIKPDNLMISEEGAIKIGDLGLSKNVQREGGDSSGEVVFGTPHFIAPEQVQKQKIDHRTDIYSLGAAFYLMLTGRTPYSGDTGREIALKHVKEPLTPLKEVNPEVPDRIGAIVGKMMAKDPRDRFQSATALLEELRRANIEINPSAAYTDGFPGIPPSESSQGRGPLVPVMAGLVILAVAAVALAFALGLIGGSEPAPVPVPDVPDGTNPDDGGTKVVTGQSDEAKRLEEEKRRLEAEKKKQFEEKATAAYLTAAGAEERSGMSDPEVLRLYRLVAAEFAGTEAAARAAAKVAEIEARDKARTRIEEDAESALAEAEGRANLLMKDWYFGKALAEFDSFPAEKFKGTAAVEKIQARKNFVSQKAASTFAQISSSAASSLSQGDFGKARELLDKVVSNFGIESFVLSARKKRAEVDGEEAKIRKEASDRELARDEALFNEYAGRAEALSKSFEYEAAASEIGRITPPSSDGGRSLATQQFISRGAALARDFKNLSRLQKQVVDGVNTQAGKLQLELSKTQGSSDSKIARILAADEKGIKIQVGPGKTSLGWTDLTPAEYHSLGVMALPRNPESHLLLGVYSMHAGGELAAEARAHFDQALETGIPEVKKEAREYLDRLSGGGSVAGKASEDEARALYEEFATLYKKACSWPDAEESIKMLEKCREILSQLRDKYGETKVVKDMGKKGK